MDLQSHNMCGKFQQRRWNYWVILLFLAGEFCFLAFTAIFGGLMVLLSRRPDGVEPHLSDIWTETDIGFKMVVFDMLETMIIALIVSILLLFRRRVAFAVYLLNVGLFIIISVDKAMHLGTARYGLSTEDTMFALIFGSIQVGLVSWGLWSICYQRSNKGNAAV